MSGRAHGREGEPVPAPEKLPGPVVDTHCHLDLMGGDVAAELALARSVGVADIVTVGIDLETSRWQAQIAAEYPRVYATAAIHPNAAAGGEAHDEALRGIEDLAALPQVRAVGETGLDYFRTVESSGHRAQQESLRAHIAIAKRTGKALVVHNRDAHADTLRILAEEGAPERVVIHAFSGDAEFARACVRVGYACSFAGNVTFKNADNLRAAAAVVPPDLLLVETDAPFLTPMPFRGRPNGPHLVPLTVRALAQVRGEQVETTCAGITATAGRIFQL